MSSGSACSVRTQSIDARGLSVLPQTRKQTHILKSASRPWTLGLVGLAITVALWGYGYKISRYNPHLDAASRASFAKLWDKHQDASQILASKGSDNAHHCLGLLALLTAVEESIKPVVILVPDGQNDNGLPASFTASIPFRSPPSLNPLA